MVTFASNKLYEAMDCVLKILWDFFILGLFLDCFKSREVPDGESENSGMEMVRWSFQLLIVEAAGLLYLVQVNKFDFRSYNDFASIVPHHPLMASAFVGYLASFITPGLIYFVFSVLVFAGLVILYRVKKEESDMYYYNSETRYWAHKTIVAGFMLVTILLFASSHEALPGQIKKLRDGKIKEYSFDIDDSDGIRLLFPFEIEKIIAGKKYLNLRISIDPVLSDNGWYIANAFEDSRTPNDILNRLELVTEGREKQERKVATVSLSGAIKSVTVDSQEQLTTGYILKGERFMLAVLLKRDPDNKGSINRERALQGLKDVKYYFNLELPPSNNE